MRVIKNHEEARKPPNITVNNTKIEQTKRHIWKG